MNGSLLFEQSDMANPSRVPAWLMREYRSFHEIAADDAFPCTFGQAAEKDGQLRYTFLQRDDISPLPSTLAAFLRLSRSNPDVRHNLTVFFEPEAEAKRFEYYRDRFWQILNFLHADDCVPWPSDIPTDPDDPLWEFCFGGEPIFMFAACPAYIHRRSRNYCNSLVMFFQPKRIFKGIEAESAAGTRVRRVIRSRLQRWDGTDKEHPDIVGYGEPLTFRWKQYLLSDDGTPAHGKCPFIFRKESDVSYDEQGPTVDVQRGIAMESLGSAHIVRGEKINLEQAVQQLLPEVGSVRVRRDSAGFAFPTHEHDTDEILLVVDGEIRFEAGGEASTCTSGDRLILPRGARHSSIAGESGCIYVIALK